MDSHNEFIIFSKLYPFLVVANKLMYLNLRIHRSDMMKVLPA